MTDDRAPVLATTLGAPWGPVHLAATERGIAACELMTTTDAFEAGLARRLRRPIRWAVPGPDVGHGPAGRHLDMLRAVLRTWLGGLAGAPVDDTSVERRAREIPVDLDDRPVWDRAVLDAVRAIPRGEVRSYGQIARTIGRPGAARAVGGAVGRNPVGFLIPCHRVVAGDGTLGGYGGGWWGDHERLLDLKAELLVGEGVILPRSRPRGRRGR